MEWTGSWRVSIHTRGWLLGFIDRWRATEEIRQFIVCYGPTRVSLPTAEDAMLFEHYLQRDLVSLQSIGYTRDRHIILTRMTPKTQKGIKTVTNAIRS
jgi:hypothetical protein